MTARSALEWRRGAFESAPLWIEEPKSEAIADLVRKHLGLNQEQQCQVEFYAQGAFSKSYKISTPNRAFLMRVSLAVDPHYKTASEMATVQFIRQNTGFPVSTIHAFSASMDNELGFEWILLDLVPGKQLDQSWPTLSMEKKEKITREIAAYQADLLQHKFNSIGNIYISSDDFDFSTQSSSLMAFPASFKIDRIVSVSFFWDHHIIYGVPRGPFKTSYDWLQARLKIVLQDQEDILKDAQDEDEIADAENAWDIAKNLLDMLPIVFSPKEAEEAVLFHHDLSMQNMLIDNDGNLSAITNWDCVSVLPLWRFCQIPSFLMGRDRDTMPSRKDYPSGGSKSELDPKVADSEGVNNQYWEHLMEYEQTRLRHLFIVEMERLSPAWLEQFKKGAFKADFEAAVSSVYNGSRLKVIRDWIDACSAGKIWSLRDRLIQ